MPFARYATPRLGVSSEFGGPTGTHLTQIFVVLICDCVVPDAPLSGSETEEVQFSFEDTLKSIENDAVSTVYQALC